MSLSDSKGAGLLADYLTPAEFAAAIGRCERTLQRWEKERLGPPIIRVAGVRLYRRSAVIAWLEKQEIPMICEPARKRRRALNGGSTQEAR